MTVEYLDVEDLLFLVGSLGIGPVRDVGALDAAVARSRSRVFGLDSYPSIEGKTAALMHSICRTNGLATENERLAVVAGVMLLRANGSKIEPEHDEVFELVRGLTEGRVDVEQAAQVLTN